MSLLRSFLDDTSAHVSVSGAVVYVVVLGLFASIVVGLKHNEGSRTLQASSGPNWIVDIGALLGGEGTGLPQMGPLHAGR